MSLFERYLSLWVALCIVIGIGLGHLIPDAFEAIAALEIANVNLVVAVLIWLMIIGNCRSTSSTTSIEYLLLSCWFSIRV